MTRLQLTEAVNSMLIFMGRGVRGGKEIIPMQTFNGTALGTASSSETIHPSMEATQGGGVGKQPIPCLSFAPSTPTTKLAPQASVQTKSFPRRMKWNT